MARAKKMIAEGGGGHDLSIDLKPFINFLVVLIPVLMLSAEFAKISIINLKLPEGRGSQTDSAVKDAPLQDDSEKLLLTMIVTDSVVTIGAKGGFLPSLFYTEYHKYVWAEDHRVVKEIHVDAKNPNAPVINPQTNKPFKLGERSEIKLYVTDENGKVMECMYTKENALLTDGLGMPVQKAVPGDTVWILANPRRQLVVQSPDDVRLQPLQAYDEMKNRLMRIKEKYRESADADDIIIAAENQVAYDKIIQLMDVARDAEFPNIAIAKLRS
jgi:biopolymer transport protein ExbD